MSSHVKSIPVAPLLPRSSHQKAFPIGDDAQKQLQGKDDAEHDILRQLGTSVSRTYGPMDLWG